MMTDNHTTAAATTADFDDLVFADTVTALPGFLPGSTLQLQLHGADPAGAVRLATATELVAAAEQSGRLGNGARLIEAASGTLGVALAMVCAAAGHPLTVVVDPAVDARQRRMIESLGAELVVAHRAHPKGGFAQAKADYVANRVAREPGLAALSALGTGASAEPRWYAGLSEVDHVFVAGDASGNAIESAADVVGYLRAKVSGPTVYTVDVSAAGDAADLAHDDGRFHNLLVPARDAVDMVRRLSAERGLLVGGPTAALLAGALQVRADIRPGSVLAALSPDPSHAYTPEAAAARETAAATQDASAAARLAR